MKVLYKGSKFAVEFVGETKELFKQIAEFQEIFEEDTCGQCGKKNVKLATRVVDDNIYHEVVCKDCGAKLSFGQNKKGGGLFPKRKTADGKYDVKNKGWHFYKGNERNDDATEDVDDDPFVESPKQATPKRTK